MMQQFDLFGHTPRFANVPKASPMPLHTGAEAVLRKLKERGNKGVTWDNFPRGFALRSRISDLRKKGYQIHTENQKLPDLGGGCIRAKYILLQS